MTDNRDVAGAYLQGVVGIPPKAAGEAFEAQEATGIPAQVGMHNPTFGQGKIQEKQDSQALQNGYVGDFVAKSPAHAAAAQKDLPLLDQISGGLQQLGLAAVTGLGSVFETQNTAETLFGAEYDTPSVGEQVGGIAPPRTPIEKGIREYGPFVAGGVFGEGAFARGLNIFAPAAGSFAGKQLVKAAGGGETAQQVGGIAGAVLGGFGAGYRMAKGIQPIEGETNGALYGQAHPVEPTSSGLYRTDKFGTLVDPEGTAYKFNDPHEAAVWGLNNLDRNGQAWNVFRYEDGTATIVAKTPHMEEPPPVEPAEPQGPESPVEGEIVPEEPRTPSVVAEAVKPQEPEQALTETGTTSMPLEKAGHQASQNALTNLSDMVAQSQVFQHSPGMMKEFLEQHGLAEADVNIDSTKIMEALGRYVTAAGLQPGTPEFKQWEDFTSQVIRGQTGKESQVPLSDFLTFVAGASNKPEFIAAASLYPNVAEDVHPSTAVSATTKEQSGPFTAADLAGDSIFKTGDDKNGTTLTIKETKPGQEYHISESHAFDGDVTPGNSYHATPQEALRAVNYRFSVQDPDGNKSSLSYKKHSAPVKSAKKSTSTALRKVEDWKPVAAKPGGAQPGAIYEDERGILWLVKGSTTKDDNKARSEVLAANLMELAGIPAPTMKLVDLGSLHGGGLGVASKMMDLETPANAFTMSVDQLNELDKDYAIHAWVGNRDWAGPPGNPVNEAHNAGIIKGTNKTVFFDTGGSLFYTGLGQFAKHFDTTVKEWEGLQDFKVNPTAAKFFEDLKFLPDVMQLSAEKLLGVQDEDIRKVVEASGIKLPSEYKPVKGIFTYIPGTDLDSFPKDLPTLKPWVPPTNWSGVEGTAGVPTPDSFQELADKAQALGKTPGSGVVVIEPDGRFWITHPTNGHAGYTATFAKGTSDPGLTLEENAIKETWEELGIHAEITHHLGDFERPGSLARLYVGRRLGGNLTPHWESEKVSLVSTENADQLLNQWHVDGPVVEAIKKFLKTPEGKALAPNSAPPDYAQIMIDRKYTILQKAGVLDADQVAAAKQLQVAVGEAVEAQADASGMIPSSGVSFDRLFSGPNALMLGQTQFDHYQQTVEDAIAKMTKQTQQEVLLAKAKTNVQQSHNYQVDVAGITDKYMQMPVYKAILNLIESGVPKNFFSWPNGKPKLFVHYSGTAGIGLTPELEAQWKTGQKPLGPFKPMGYGVICFKEIDENWDPSKITDFNKGLPATTGVLGGTSYKYFVHLETNAADFRKQEDVDKAATMGYSKSDLASGSYSIWEPITKANPFGWDGSYMLEYSHSPISYDHNSLGINVKSGKQVHLRYAKPTVGFNLTSKDLIEAAKNNDLIDHLNDGIKISTNEKSHPSLKGLPKDWFADTGLSLDQLASQVGAGSGDSLAAEIQTVMQTVGKGNFKDWLQSLIDQEAKDEYEKQVGGVVNPTQIQTAVQKVFNGPSAVDFLIKQYHQLGAIAKQEPLEIEDLEEASRESFLGQRVKGALNAPAKTQQMFQASRELEDALIEGDAIKAFQAKQKQLDALFKQQAGHSFAENFAQDAAEFAKDGKKDALARLDHDIATVYQSLLKLYKVPVERSQDELLRGLEDLQARGKPSNLPDLIESFQQAGYNVPFVAFDPAWSKYRNPFTAMTVEQYNTVSEMLKAIKHIAERSREVTDGQDKIEFDSAVRDIVAAGGFHGGRFTDAQLNEKGYWHNAKSVLSSFLGVGQLRPETWLSYFDGKEFGPMQRLVLKLAYEALDLQGSLQKEFQDLQKTHAGAIKGFKEGHELANMRSPDGNGVPIVLDRGDLVHAALHFGSASARRKFLKGYELPPEMEKIIFSRLRPEEEAFIQDYWKHQEKLFQLADAMHREMYGYGLPKDKARPVKFRAAGKQPGGHVHIEYDVFKTMQLRAAQIKEQGFATTPEVPVNPVTTGMPIAKLPHNSYGIKRSATFFAPVRLGISGLNAGVNEVIHDVAFRPALAQMQKILMDPTVGSTIATTLGRNYQEEIKPWLEYIAEHDTQTGPSGFQMGKLMSTLVNNEISASLGFKVVSTITHSGIAAVHTLVMLDVRHVAQASIELSPFHPNGAAKIEFVRANSLEVRKALNALPWEYFAGITEDFYHLPLQDRVMRYGYAMMSVMRVMQSQVAWLAKYNEVLAGHRGHLEATYLADQAVRNVMGSFSIVDTAPLYRTVGTNIANAFLKSDLEAFMGLRNAAYNKQWFALMQMNLGIRQLQGKSQGGVNAGWKNIVKGLGVVLGLIFLSAMMLSTRDTALNYGQEGDSNPREAGKYWLDHLTMHSWSQPVESSIFGALVAEPIKFVHSHHEGILETGLESPAALYNAAHGQSEKVTVEAIKHLLGLVAIPNEAVNLGQMLYDHMHPANLVPAERTPLGVAERLTGSRSPHLERQSAARGNHSHNSSRSR